MEEAHLSRIFHRTQVLPSEPHFRPVDLCVCEERYLDLTFAAFRHFYLLQSNVSLAMKPHRFHHVVSLSYGWLVSASFMNRRKSVFGWPFQKIRVVTMIVYTVLDMNDLGLQQLSTPHMTMEGP